MSIVLSVYSKKAFKEYLLPTLNNADYSINLEREYFHLREDIMIKMEVLDEKWRIKHDVKYKVRKNNHNYALQTLQNQDILVLENSTDKISILVKEVDSVFHTYEKFNIRNVQSLSIGSDAGNDVVYNYLKTVSKEHAIIQKKNGEHWIVNKSANGTYVNSEKIETETKLHFGDYINIMGLHIVYLDGILAIDTDGKDIKLNKDKLKSFEMFEDQTMYLTGEQTESKGKTIYHRAPRNYERLEETSVEIEDPPEKSQQKKQSLFMVIGPSLTMVLPMILGCVLMIYASSQSNGAGASLYMYSGLVMSGSSALIGVMWSLINIRTQKKEEEAREAHRYAAYGDYLQRKTDEIKEKYENTTKMLTEMYPSTADCLKYDEKGGVLWNRNRTHEDFLMHRLGIGDIPFQVSINISKERFRLYEDDLSKKPAFIKENYENLYRVPVTVDFSKHNLIGVIGGAKKTGAFQVAQILSAQLAANNCYTDVKLGYIFNGASSVEKQIWNFAKWLPHTWSEDKKTRFIASNKEEASDVFYELTNVLRNRQEEQSSRRNEEKIPKPYYIIFVSDASLLEGEIFSKYAFDKENNFGLTTVFLAERYEELPNSCEFIIQNDAKFHGMYDVFDREDEKVKIEFDSVNTKALEVFSSNLAGLQVQEMESGGEIPSTLTFFEMLGVNKLEDIPVKELWAKNRIYENIKGLIGQKAGGVPCYLDVHEKYHGPHGLVAGTTGSGKSETLQTYMLSLAVNYSPDDIGFFVIDYKGGGMANLFDGLPHMIGQISNLSGNQVKRAMISIKSENRRRQRVFNENGVNNINAYTKLYKNGETTLPVPHLFIVIDEFAELKREEPEFMKELISVAQVGRSLGVHLVLATQKPSGTVDDNIWSNSKFRLCLRVQDKQDSNDMLHKPDAAYITQAGRCYLQVGNDEIYELFQSGYSGAAYNKDQGNEKTDIAKLITLNGKVEMTGNIAKASRKKKAQYAWIEKLSEAMKITLNTLDITAEECLEDRSYINLIVKTMYDVMGMHNIEYARNNYNEERLMDFAILYCEAVYNGEKDVPAAILKNARQKMKNLPEMKEKTQLEAVKEYLAKMAKEGGYEHNMQLWLPVLPENIYLDSFEEFRRDSFKYSGWNKNRREWSLDVVIGKMDDPADQAQMPLEVDFANAGHIAICGNIVSGKSTMIQTMIYAMLQKYTPEEINIYGLDFSSKMMYGFEQAPQVGGIMYDSDIEKIGKFFNMIEEILENRKKLFRGGNYSQYVRVNGTVLPAIIIFVDNYSAFKEKTKEAFEETMIRLSKEGVNHGIYLVVSGAGFGMNNITTRVGENINTVLCLALQDKYAYGDLLHNMQIQVMPEAGIKGRGLAYHGSKILEYQTALAVEAENDYQRMEIIKDECQRMRQSWTKKVARQVPEIPEKPTWSIFRELEEFDTMCADAARLPIGYDAANARVYGIPLDRTYCYLFWGANKTGKENALRMAIQSAMCKNSEICIIDTPEKLLKNYETQGNITYACDEDSVFNFFASLLPEFKRRNVIKRDLIAQDYEEHEIFERMSQEKPYFIFISDFSWFVPFLYSAEKDMKPFLENIIAKGYLHNIYFISTMAIENKDKVAGYQIYELFKSHKTGMHFGGKVNNNPALSFDYLSYMEQSKSEKPNIGQIPDAGDEKDTKKVVIPNAKK